MSSPFTPEQMLIAAQETMPEYKWQMNKKESSFHVFAVTFYEFGMLGIIEYDPDANHEQWRALLERCLDRGLFPAKSWHFFFGNDDYILHSSCLNSVFPTNVAIKCYGILNSEYNVTAFTSTDCMLAALLAWKESNDD